MTMVRPPRDGEQVPVECWCQADIVWVLVEDVRRRLDRPVSAWPTLLAGPSDSQ